MTTKREAKRLMWRCVKAFVSDTYFEATMDDATAQLSEADWERLEAWLETAREILNGPAVKVDGAKPLPLIRAALEAPHAD